MLRVFRLLRAPSLALATLGFLALWCAAAAWLPWGAPGAPPAPPWAAALGLERPFSSIVFLAAVGLTLLSTLACLWQRVPGTLALWRGAVAGYGVELAPRGPADVAAFLRAEGFRTRSSPPWFRFRLALWGGCVLHAGLVALIAGIVVQQGWHDSAAFELAEGETRVLSAPHAVFAREHGPFCAPAPPELVVTLLAFDPYLHQPGYAPDRASRVRVVSPGRAPREGNVDRAAGFDAGGATLYQAIPSGLALRVDVQGLGARSFHLREDAPHSASGVFSAPGGSEVRFGVSAGQALDDPRGTGPLSVWMERGGARVELAQGGVFLFGERPARLVSVGRWAGFTYVRSPGMGAVYTGFTLVLLGAALMVFPAGVAQPGEPGAAAWVYVVRGGDVLLAEWAHQGGSHAGGGREA